MDKGSGNSNAEGLQCDCYKSHRPLSQPGAHTSNLLGKSLLRASCNRGLSLGIDTVKVRHVVEVDL